MSAEALAAAGRLTIAIAAILLVGWSAVRPAADPRSWLRSLASSSAVGTALLVPAAFGLVWAGGRLTAASILGLAFGWAVALAAGRKLLGGGSHRSASPRGPKWVLLPAVLALAVFTWKMSVVPLWSWDHYAIWGVKARKMLPQGTLDASWLDEAGAPARPDYPVGVPVGWRVLTLGGSPGEADVRAAHGLAAWALVALAAAAARRASGSALAGGAVAGLTAASPLLWDTESAGLADLPLALFGLAAALPLAALAEGTRDGEPDSPSRRSLWVAGVCAGFLPWIKSEGMPLAILLTAATVVGLLRSGRGRGSVAAFSIPAALLGAAGLLATPGWRDREAGFFRGDWLSRGAERLGDLPQILARAAGELLEPGWLVAWPVFAAALAAGAVWAVRRGGRPAWAGVGLGVVVAAQLAVYVATYSVSYIPWESHLETSLYRVAGALLPLALVSAAAVAGSWLAGSSGAAGSAAPGTRR